MRGRGAVAAGAAWAVGLMLLAPEPASAHGLLLEKADLPIPEWLFAWAASLVLIVSFVALSVAWRTSRFERDEWRPLSLGVSRAIVNPATAAIAGALSVGLMGVVFYAGLEGTQNPNTNIAVPFVFVTFWLGLVLFSVLFGDVFRALNPWRAIARVFGGLFRLVAGRAIPPPLTYPERLGRWPAVAGIFAFAWFELTYSAGLNTINITPEDVSVAVLIYSVWTFLGMTLFGIDKWLDRGEAFSVYFGMFASLSALEVRDGRLGVRRMLSGATRWAVVPGSIAMVLIIIGITAFDGAQEGALSEPIVDSYEGLIDLGLGTDMAFRLVNTTFMLGVIGAISGLFWLGIKGMHTVPSGRSTMQLGRLFAHSFIPIALAYLVAHYFSLFLFLEQAQFTYLLSDPLGDGSNLFGTADSGIDYGVIGAESIWYIQVGALIAGHVTALVLGHDRALTVYDDSRAAARSQYWMLALMVGFTCLGLFLLSQGNA